MISHEFGVDRKLIHVNRRYRSLEGLIRINKFDEVNPNITRNNFPVTGGGLLSGWVNLIRFEGRQSTEDVIQQFRWHSLRPLTLQEGLLLAHLKPNLQRKMTIVLAGSIGSHSDGEKRVVRLDGFEQRRSLNLGWYVKGPPRYECLGWPESCYFAGIKI